MCRESRRARRLLRIFHCSHEIHAFANSLPTAVSTGKASLEVSGDTFDKELSEKSRVPGCLWWQLANSGALSFVLWNRGCLRESWYEQQGEFWFGRTTPRQLVFPRTTVVFWSHYRSLNRFVSARACSVGCSWLINIYELYKLRDPTVGVSKVDSNLWRTKEVDKTKHISPTFNALALSHIQAATLTHALLTHAGLNCPTQSAGLSVF